MTPQEAFQQFCEQHGIEPTEDRFACWVGALHHMWTTATPVAYAPIVAGVPVGILDAIRPGMHNTVPLYAAPIPNVPKPPLNRAAAEMVLRNYEGDAEGLALWFWRYYGGK